MKFSKNLLPTLACGSLAFGTVQAQDGETSPTAEVAAEEAPQESMKIEVPSDVKAPPADAEKTASGLASKVLQKGTGTEKPSSTDTVTVHYSGWTTDGEMFDSSVERGSTTSFPLNGVIKGWTEGLQLMVVGEKRRFWIPEELAYGPKVEGSGRPGGMLVFDVELFEIKAAPKPPEDTEKSASGIAYQVIKEGEGDKPGADDIVTFHFTGKTMEGQVVQDSRAQPQPPTVPLKALPPELAEQFGAMSPGGQRKVWLPETQIPGGFVVAEIELVSSKPTPPAPPVPEDVAAAPADAEKTESGLSSKVLTKGTGTDHPTAESTVKVHYSGWMTDGELFDSSVQRGEPISFPLSGVIKGWTEGVQLMVVGEKRRFWIPEDLAYGPKVEGSGRPGGTLVFDVELLEIQ